MRNLHIGIYSPRPAILEELGGAAAEFLQTACLDLTLHTFPDHAGLMDALSDTSLELLVYDTRLEEGLEERVWEVVRAVPGCGLVLLGDDTRHALFGYAVRAVGYLLTPLDPEDLIDLLARLIRERMEAKEQFLPLKLEGVWSRLNMEHIAYLESSKHNMLFHMDDGKVFRTIASYRDYQSLLDLNRHFCRCHKSYTVNLRHVAALEQSAFLMRNGERVNISRAYRRDARSYYACYRTSHYEKDLRSELKTVPHPERDDPGLVQKRE